MSYRRGAPPYKRSAAHAGTWDGRYSIGNHGSGLWYDLTTDFEYPATRLTIQQLAALDAAGVSRRAIEYPYPLASCRGHCLNNWMFEADPNGPQWIVIPVAWDDWVLWNHQTGKYAFYAYQHFAVGEEWISHPSRIYSGACLEIFATPLEWLAANRRGIVIIDWKQAHDRLRDCHRIAYPKSLSALYHKHMKPKSPEAFLRIEA